MARASFERIRRIGIPSIGLDIFLVSVLFAVAVAVRLPYYMTIPVITDETREVLFALEIARGESFPLANVSTYIGPVFLYLLAICFRLFGVSPELPRLFVLAVSALTVVATYWLGKLWANRLAALLGAALFSTAATHIWVNSHIANSASTSPLFTTLTIIALTYAQRKGSARRWIAAGLLYGLAMLTHPTVLLLAPALILWVVLDPKNRAQLRTPIPYFAIVAALVAFSPLLVHNFLEWGSSRASFTSITRRTYAFGLPENFGAYGSQVVNTVIAIWRAFAAQFVALDSWNDYLQFILLFYLALLAASVVLVWRRGNTLPALVFLFTPLLLALFVRVTIFPYDTRYYAFVLPIGYIAIGIFLDTLLRAIWTWTPQDARWTRRKINIGMLPPLALHRLVRVLIIGIIAVNLIRLALYPLYALVGVNNFFSVNGPNSAGMLELTRLARTASAQVWLDTGLNGPDYWMCNGATAGEALGYLMTLSSVPLNTFDASRVVVLQSANAAPQWVAATPTNAMRLQEQYRMKRIAATPPPGVHCAPAVIEMYALQP